MIVVNSRKYKKIPLLLRNQSILLNAELQRRTIKRFTGSLIFRGNKRLAQKIVREVFSSLAEKFQNDPFEIFFKAISEVKPSIEMVSRKNGGTTYRIPNLISEEKGVIVALKWIIEHGLKRHEPSISSRLIEEIVETYEGKNFLLRKKVHQIHMQGLQNRAFMHKV